MSCHLVFQSKVLQRLYPAAPKSETKPSPPRTVEALAKQNYRKRKTFGQNAAAGTMTLSSPVTFNACKSTIFCERSFFFLYFSFWSSSLISHISTTSYTFKRSPRCSHHQGSSPSFICTVCLRRCRKDAERHRSGQADVHGPTSSRRLQDRFREIRHTRSARKHK